MLSSAHRLSRSEFFKVKSSSSRHTFPLLTIYSTPGTGKAAVVTSSKLSKSAVIRNKLRRRIFSSLTNITHLDLIIYPSPKLLTQNYAQIRTVVNQALSSLSTI